MAAAGGSIGLCCNPIHHHHHGFFFHFDPSPPLAAQSSVLFCPSLTMSVITNTLLPSSSSYLRPSIAMALAAESSMTNSLDEEREAARVERLWQQFFSDPSQWWDKRFDKENFEAPDFEHKTTKKALRINDGFSPSWLHAKLATLPQQPPQQSSSSSYSSSSSTSKISSGQALKMKKLWEEFFSDPSQWWDNRSDDKRNARFPDFKHKTAKKVLWTDNRLNPSWVQARLAAMVQCQKQSQSGHSTPEISGIVRMEYLWREFFSDPSQWWDNRSIKKSPKYPDFRHKSTHEGLWIEGWLNPTWVKSKMATKPLSQLQSGGGLRSWIPNSSGNGDNMSKLCEEGPWQEALHTVELMVQQNTRAPINAYVGLLKECSRRKDLAEGKRVHALIVQSGLDSDIFLGNTLVDMYGKCGSVLDAHQVFNSMPEHNVFSWTAIMSAYANHGQGDEAINLYQKMQQTGIRPDKVAYIVVLKSCARIAALELGKQVHSDIIKSGFEYDVIVGNTLVGMYAKCGCIEDACQVFNSMIERDAVSWNVMIAGYAQQGLVKEALALYGKMKQEDVQPDKVTYVVLLKACASIAALEQGKQLHSDIIRSGFGSNLIVGNTLIRMYARCGCMEDARDVFIKMNERDVVSWNAIIAGYAQKGLGTEAIALYEQMKQKGVQPDNVTCTVLLKACASISALEQGKQIYSDIIKSGFESDVIVRTALVDMYAKCGCIEDAHEVFRKLSERDVVSWNAMIAGYAKLGLGKEVLALYEQMKQEDVQPDSVTYVTLLNACASIAALEQGKQVHSHIIKSGFEPDVIMASALVDMYAKCGSVEHARQVFNKMSERDVVSWNAMIAGYAQNGLGKEALALYEQMRQEDLQPNYVTYVVLLNACASIAALEQGKQLHSHIIKSGFEPDVVLGNTLVNFYTKCGSIEHAHQVFNDMHERDVVSWNAMIAGYAKQGLGKEVLTLLEQMQSEGTKPNEVTYVCVLSACSHSGLVDEGRHLFDSMCEDNGVTPTVDHCACMVDLLGRAGCVADAEDFVKRMPIQPNALVWMTLLGAARNHGHVEIGRRAFDSIMKLDPENAAAYVLLSNIYAAAGRMDAVAKIRKTMKDASVKKMPGCTSIEVDN